VEITPPNRQSGFALIIVLWTLVLITLIVTQLGVMGRKQTQIAQNLRAAQAAQDDADGAIYQAMWHLSDPSPQRWVADGHEYPLGRTVSVQATDEAGKIDLNASSIELLQSLLLSVGADSRTAETTAQHIVEWRYPNADPAKLASMYRSAGRDYAPPQAPFETVDELGLVLGMTPDLLRLLRPHLTIWHPTDPDPTVADPVVLQALREKPGNTAAVRPVADAPLRVLTLIAMAAEPSGARFTRRAVVLQMQGGAWRILDWSR
jgi:general secretion pathway protein K